MASKHGNEIESQCGNTPVQNEINYSIFSTFCTYLQSLFLFLFSFLFLFRSIFIPTEGAKTFGSARGDLLRPVQFPFLLRQHRPDATPDEVLTAGHTDRVPGDWRTLSARGCWGSATNCRVCTPRPVVPLGILLFVTLFFMMLCSNCQNKILNKYWYLFLGIDVRQSNVITMLAT